MTNLTKKLPKLEIEHIETSVRARKAVGASKVQIEIYMKSKLMWVGQYHIISLEHMKNTLRKDGTLAAHVRRPIEELLERGADDFKVTIL